MIFPMRFTDKWTKINIAFYKDSADAVFKALME